MRQTVQRLVGEEAFGQGLDRHVWPRTEVQMHIWRDVWPELSVLLVLIAMAGVLTLTYILGR